MKRFSFALLPVAIFFMAGCGESDDCNSPGKETYQAVVSEIVTGDYSLEQEEPLWVARNISQRVPASCEITRKEYVEQLDGNVTKDYHLTLVLLDKTALLSGVANIGKTIVCCPVKETVYTFKEANYFFDSVLDVSVRSDGIYVNGHKELALDNFVCRERERDLDNVTYDERHEKGTIDISLAVEKLAEGHFMLRGDNCLFECNKTEQGLDMTMTEPERRQTIMFKLEE